MGYKSIAFVILMSVIYPQISKPGGFGMGLCAGRRSPAPTSYTHLFCILFLYPPPPRPLPPHGPSAWMYSTSRSSICFCSPIKRSIIICRMHSPCAARRRLDQSGRRTQLGMRVWEGDGEGGREGGAGGGFGQCMAPSPPPGSF